MKATISLFRTAEFPTGHLLANLNRASDWPDPLTDSFLMAALRDRFGALAPRLRLFHQPRKSIAGIEVMTFDVKADALPQAGLVMTDPIDALEVARIDGALRSELERIGISSDAKDYEWRTMFEIKGN